jgi:probable O-glycosylation ligase (exosortase A-associated)
MRGLLLFTSFFSLLPFVFLKGPFVGILMWYWVSLMNPQKWVWGSSFGNIPYALLTAVATLTAWLLWQREPKLPPANKTTLLIVIMMIWISVTALLGIGPPDQVYQKWELAEKMFFMTLVAYALLTTRERTEKLIVVCVLSIAFWGAKGGLGSLLMTGGASRVLGPADTMIGDNNDLGVALTMILPLMFYIRDRYRHPALKWPMLGLIGLTFIGDLLTYSRGALVALLAMGCMLWWRSRQKVRMAAIIIIAAIGVWNLAPSWWFERMDTIQTYQQDASAESRLGMWKRVWFFALDHPIAGGGFHWSYDPDLVNRLLAKRGLPPLTRPLAAHSNWFEMLGDHGFVGLAIFIAIVVGTAVDGRWLVRHTRNEPDLLWANNLGRMIQASLIGYCAGGSFATQAMFDGFYALVIITAASRRLVAAELASRNTASAGKISLPAPARQPALRPQPSG